jgi:hypothetical protein
VDRIDKPEKNKKKPDFMIEKKKEIYFFFIEIKSPEALSKCQAEDDFVKLLKQMEGSIDDQLSFGINSPTSIGLLDEGMSFYTSRIKNMLFNIYFDRV